jgi:hypothetical protein
MNRDAAKRDFQIRKSHEAGRKAPLTSRNSIHLDKDVAKGLAASYVDKETSIQLEERKISSLAPNHQARQGNPATRLPPIAATSKAKPGDFRSTRANYAGFGEAAELQRQDRSGAAQLTPRSKITVGKAARPTNNFSSQANLAK